MRALGYATGWLWDPELPVERADRVYPLLCLPGLQGVVLKSNETGSEGIVVDVRESLGKWQKCG